MDTYLAAFTEALTDRTWFDYDRNSVENAYYARHCWTPSLPAWLSRLGAALRHAATARAAAARHA